MGLLTLGLDISKLTATYWILDEIPEDPKRFARLHRQQKLEANADGRDKLLSLKFDFAVLEPTGVYSRIWRHWLKQAGREYRLVGHEELANYRKAWKLQKTDKLDGLAMAMYGIERANRSSAWLIERDYRLSDLVLYHSHLNRQKNGFQNNLRQKLCWQVPEWYEKAFYREWLASRTPGMLTAIAGNPSRKWEKELQSSCGMGLDDMSASLARILIQIEAEEYHAETLIKAEISKPQYQPYLRAAEACGFSEWLTICLVAAIYPFSQFLDPAGKRKIIHIQTKTNNKRVRKDESLRSFKLACGLGLIWIQSGDFEGWVAGGNGDARKNLHNSIRIDYLSLKKQLKQGKDLQEEEYSDMKLVKNYYDKQGIMKVARRWIEEFYKELVKEFC